MNIKLIFILTLSLFGKIVSYFVFPDHIIDVYGKVNIMSDWDRYIIVHESKYFTQDSFGSRSDLSTM